MADKTSGDEVYDLIADACGVEIADRFFFIFAGSSIGLPENPENIMTNNAVVMAMGVDTAVQIATAVGSYRVCCPLARFPSSARYAPTCFPRPPQC